MSEGNGSTDPAKVEMAAAMRANTELDLELVTNELRTIRTKVFEELFDDRRDVDEECGYPKTIDDQQYRYLYDRVGVAKRVVEVWPEACWGDDPEVTDDDDSENRSEFEQAWDDLEEKHNLWHMLHRADVISGIGRYGVLFLGLDDGADFSDPAPGVNLVTGEREDGQAQARLLYVRAFDESALTIDRRETDRTSPRFGQPVLYTVNFKDQTLDQLKADQSIRVHWTRVVHLADNRETSEVFGTPRNQVVFNRLYDLRKVAGGSGEMFWKGAFPGYSFEVDPDTELNTTTFRNQIEDFQNGLQRYIALAGVTAKSLEPQVEDPSPHVAMILGLIAITIGVPKRVFMGSEQAQLASEQDTRTWNKRVKRRQNKYVTPMVIRPVIDRLIALGVLPAPTDDRYHVSWPDLNTVTDAEKAEVAKAVTESLAKYVTGDVQELIAPEDYLSIVLGFGTDDVKRIMDGVMARQEEVAEQDMERQARAMAAMPPPDEGDPTEE